MRSKSRSPAPKTARLWAQFERSATTLCTGNSSTLFWGACYAGQCNPESWPLQGGGASIIARIADGTSYTVAIGTSLAADASYVFYSNQKQRIGASSTTSRLVRLSLN